MDKVRDVYNVPKLNQDKLFKQTYTKWKDWRSRRKKKERKKRDSKKEKKEGRKDERQKKNLISPAKDTGGTGK